MKKKIRYTNAPKDVEAAIKRARIVPDFLPSPDQLVFKEDTVKVTLALSRKSVEFFKRYAEELHVPYQRMIKNVVDRYAHNFQDA